MSPRRKKSKTPIGILMICIILLGIGIWFLIQSDDTTTKDVAPTNTVTGTESKTNPTTYPTVTSTDKKINEGGPDTSYLLAVTYPLLTVSDTTYASAVSTMNSEIKSSVDGIIADFKSQIDGIIETPDDQSSLLVHNTIAESGAIITITYTISEYTSGAAHPLTSIQTAAYDLRKGQAVALGDLFTPGSSYLNTLSTLSRAALYTKLGSSGDKETIDTGTTADPENFKVFKVTDDALVLIFNPYQVASYAAGIIQISIPWSDLSSIVKPGARN